MSINTKNVDIAIGLTFGAGLSTLIGASVVFFPSFINIASKRGLAVSLGVSAGVMLYVSFVKIFFESIESFEGSGIEENTAYQYSTLCFFIGVGLMLILDLLVKYIHGDYLIHKMCSNKTNVNVEGLKSDDDANQNITSPQCIGCLEDPVRELDNWKKKLLTRSSPHNDDIHESETIEIEIEEQMKTKEDGSKNGTFSHDSSQRDVEFAEIDLNNEEEKVNENRQLVRMGFNTALAITLHNIPEGLATFFGTLDNPAVGASIAVAIVLHNIPLGLCIALPIYYATGNRKVAFLWGACSGISEPLVAIIIWAIVRSALSESLYGVLFGLVAGMMVIISVKELLPTALRFDHLNTVTTYSFIAGMIGMCLPLIIFTV